MGKGGRERTGGRKKYDPFFPFFSSLLFGLVWFPQLSSVRISSFPHLALVLVRRRSSAAPLRYTVRTSIIHHPSYLHNHPCLPPSSALAHLLRTLSFRFRFCSPLPRRRNRDVLTLW